MGILDKHRNLSDEQLFALLRKDDIRAFEAIYKRYSSMLLNFVTRMLKDNSRAEDVIQNIFIKLYSMRKALDQNTNIRSFLFVCAKNEVLNLLKSKWVSSVDSIPQSLDVQDISDIEESLISAEQTKALLESISSLPDRRQEIFRLKRLENLSSKEIALRLGLSVRTVEKQLQLANTDLRGKLN